jgi:hypothetical protein
VPDISHERRGVWIGGRPVLESVGRARAKLILPTRTEDVVLSLPPAQARWLTGMIQTATPEAKSPRDGYPRLIDMRKQFEETLQQDFDEFRNGTAWQRTRKAGLLLV